MCWRRWRVLAAAVLLLAGALLAGALLWRGVAGGCGAGGCGLGAVLAVLAVAATKHIWPGLVVAPDQGGVNAVGDSVLDVAW